MSDSWRKKDSINVDSLNLICKLTTPNPFFTKIATFDNLGNSVDISSNGRYVDSKSVNILLPVEISTFTSTVNKNNVTLNWTSAKEDNNAGFDIERKESNSTEWVKTGNVTGNSTTEETKSYSFAETVNTGKYSYRLKQIDFNGNYEYHQLLNEVEVGIPDKYSLSQNYPNPFNPTTKIDFELPTDGNVSITLYDVSGREVSKLINEVKKTAGYYTVQFNASNLSSGMYFYRISAGNFIATKKMVVLK